jgi:hypothetical protein
MLGGAPKAHEILPVEQLTAGGEKVPIGQLTNYRCIPNQELGRIC